MSVLGQYNVFYLWPWRESTTAEPKKSLSRLQCTDCNYGPRRCWRKHTASAQPGKCHSRFQHTNREPTLRRCIAIST
jgi:hypothetical protein